MFEGPSKNEHKASDWNASDPESNIEPKEIALTCNKANFRKEDTISVESERMGITPYMHPKYALFGHPYLLVNPITNKTITNCLHRIAR